jgi:uncharacterized membrane protein (DUF485 family)
MASDNEITFTIIIETLLAVGLAVITGFGMLFLEISVLENSIYEALTFSFLVSSLITTAYSFKAQDMIDEMKEDNNGE